MPNPAPGYTILERGRLRPGLYKIQNLVSKTYVDIHQHSMELCCRPTSSLERDDGIWEVLPFGAGYTIRMEHPDYAGKPDLFCTVKKGLGSGTPLCASSFPVAWNIQVTEDEIYRGFEYVRIFWPGQKSISWDLESDGSKNDGAKVQLMDDERILPCRVWKFTPVNGAEGETRARVQATTPTTTRSNNCNNSLPPYGQETCCSCSHHSTETKDDGELGTTVTEVTTVTTTTRKKYRMTDE